MKVTLLNAPPVPNGLVFPSRSQSMLDVPPVVDASLVAATLDPSKFAQNGPLPWIPAGAPRRVNRPAAGSAGPNVFEPSVLQS
jgi:hypothetical protein